MIETPEEIDAETVQYFLNGFGYYYFGETDKFSHIYRETFIQSTEWAMKPRLWEKHGFVKIDGPYTGHEINQHYLEWNVHEQGNLLDEPRIIATLTQKGLEFLFERKRAEYALNNL